MSTLYKLIMILIMSAVCIIMVIGYIGGGCIGRFKDPQATQEVTITNCVEEKPTTYNQLFNEYYTIDYVPENVNQEVPKISDDTKKQFNELIENQSTEDKYSVPGTRVNETDVILKSYLLGLLDYDRDSTLFIGTEELEKLRKELDQPITRKEYVEIFNKVQEFGQFSSVGCCMGDKPDLSQVENDPDLKKAFNLAATTGYLCTREGARPDDNLTVMELDTFTTKLMRSLPYNLDGSSIHEPYSVEEFKEDYKQEKINGLKQSQIEFLTEGVDLGSVIRTTDNKLLIGEDATKLQVLIQAINLLDNRIIYTKMKTDDNLCIPCIETGVDDWYDILYDARDEKRKLIPNKVQTEEEQPTDTNKGSTFEY